VRVLPEQAAVVLEGAPPRVFSFDFVAGADASQELVFDNVGKPVTEACFAGYNTTIFCYGQTGSG
jgi:kinesin family protein 15